MLIWIWQVIRRSSKLFQFLPRLCPDLSKQTLKHAGQLYSSIISNLAYGGLVLPLTQSIIAICAQKLNQSPREKGFDLKNWEPLFFPLQFYFQDIQFMFDLKNSRMYLKNNS